MSFILDALKKSEIERQRQTVPGLMDTRGTPQRNRLPLWAALLAGLLVVNLLVLAYVLTRNRAAVPQVAAIPNSDNARVRPEIPRTAPFSPLDAAPVYAPEIPVTAPAAAQSTPVFTPPVRVARRPDPVRNEQDAKADDDVLPTIAEINLTGAQALPEIHLDVHVYATQPADRFVFINMRKYHEGATLQEGPTIERIRRDGVILNYHGLRFLLPRQS